jgi:hypothetical protein
MHTCFDEMNARLKPHNAQIAHGFALVDDAGKTSMRLTYYVQTEKLDTNVRSKKPPLVVMTFCPMCGIELDKPVEATP